MPDLPPSPRRRRLRVVSDGLGPISTHILDAETGEELRSIRKVTWSHDAGSVPRVVVEQLAAAADVEGLEAARGADLEQLARGYLEALGQVAVDLHQALLLVRPRPGEAPNP